MTSDLPTHDDYRRRPVPLDEWGDVDTLINRTSATSGDFDYILRPLCPDCGSLLEIEYEEFEDGTSQLLAIVCDECKVEWQLAEGDA
jgi:hypothetical protein